jgi:murein DD-endopeptidase MepM/ murein hydrolase activator NlpD
VLIDHENGEYSLLVHMKPGSVLVRSGDRVKQGQKVGAIGFAGDSIFPHLHYSLMSGPTLFKDWGAAYLFSAFPWSDGSDFDPSAERLGKFGGRPRQ